MCVWHVTLKWRDRHGKCNVNADCAKICPIVGTQAQYHACRYHRWWLRQLISTYVTDWQYVMWQTSVQLWQKKTLTMTLFPFPLQYTTILCAGNILDVGSANERRHHYVKPSPIGWADTQNDPRCDTRASNPSPLYLNYWTKWPTSCRRNNDRKVLQIDLTST